MTSEDPQAGRPDERGRQQAVALVGFMGAGKSAVGRELATALGIPLVDTDDLIVAEAGPIAAIFAERGEASFRALEADVVTAAISAAADSPCVLALGGGAVLSAAVREALKTPAARRLAGRAVRGAVGARRRRGAASETTRRRRAVVQAVARRP